MSWVAIGLSSDLEPGTSTGVLIDGREYVLWRDSSGIAHVWGDRCPHRGMRLSFGFVRGDRIACLYHGWQYDTAGQCRAIPAHPDLDVPKTIRATTYPTHETCGLIWANVSGRDVGAPLIDAGEVVPVRSVTIDRPLDTVASALGDAINMAFDSWAVVADFDGFLPSVWRLREAEDRLLIAGQAVDDMKSVLHIVILGDYAPHARDSQIQIARWAEAFRNRLEAGEVAV